jgi:hypothetical protein
MKAVKNFNIHTINFYTIEAKLASIDDSIVYTKYVTFKFHSLHKPDKYDLEFLINTFFALIKKKLT